MKNLLTSTILVLALLMPALATAADFEVDDICYNINGNEAAVTRKGLPGYLFIGYSGPVVIPATVTYDGITYPVTSIEALAFYHCTELTSIDIPNSVTEIGQEAFGRCPGLASIVVESGNPRFDSRNNCNAIIETANNVLIVGCKNTIIPNSVTEIGNLAFDACDSLTSIVIPNSVTAIGDSAFYDCGRLTDVYCYIADLSKVSSGNDQFYKRNGSYSGRTLHVRQGTADAYRADENWYPYFGQIVEDIITGDANRDLEVNIADVNAVLDMILEGNDDTIAADVNGDGEINIADINALIGIILSGKQN